MSHKNNSSVYQYAIILRVCDSSDGHKEVGCGCVASWMQDRVQISNLSVSIFSHNALSVVLCNSISGMRDGREWGV